MALPFSSLLAVSISTGFLQKEHSGISGRIVKTSGYVLSGAHDLGAHPTGRPGG